MTDDLATVEKEKLKWKELYYDAVAQNYKKDDVIANFVKSHILYITVIRENEGLKQEIVRLRGKIDELVTKKARQSYAKKIKKETGDDIGDL
jgi:hypothetical protein